MSKLLFTTTAACALALAPGALAQRAIRPADAPTPEAVPQPAAPAAPEVEPLVPTPGAKKRPSPPPGPPGAAAVAPKPAGPPPKFKDDLGPDDAPAKPSGSLDCREGCEAIYRKKYESDAFALHVRPAQPKPGQLVEVVLDATEILDPPDPEIGDRKPVTGETIVAHVEGVGRFLAHPISGDAGAYGFHFVAPAKGERHVEFSRLDGRHGLDVDFAIPVGAASGKDAELREWSPPGPDRFATAAPPGGSSEDGELP